MYFNEFLKVLNNEDSEFFEEYVKNNVRDEDDVEEMGNII